MLREVLQKQIDEQKMSVRAAALAIGISHTTLHRVLDGGKYDLDTVVKVSEWMHVKPAELLGIDLGDDVSLLLASIPGLSDILHEAAAKVNTGELDVSALADITAYARFRVREQMNANRNKEPIR